MTNKTLTGTYTAGYSLATTYDGVIVAQSARIGGTGLSSSHLATVTNYGYIGADSTHTGVKLAASGSLVNGSPTHENVEIYGGITGVGVYAVAGTVTNFGFIEGETGHGLYLHTGSSVTNGSAADTSAEVVASEESIRINGVGTLNNFGVIQSFLQAGVTFVAGGVVTNGSKTDSVALIDGYGYGVVINGGIGTVNNSGTIEGLGAAAVYLGGGGSLVNGSPADRNARIVGGGRGVFLYRVAGTVTNFGFIEGETERGLYLHAGSSVINGSAVDTSAEISGAGDGAWINGVGTLNNFGVIRSSAQTGVTFVAGGAVSNGGKTDRVALIEGYGNGVGIRGGTGTVNNFGTIEGLTGGAIELGAGGIVVNGGSGDPAALAIGYAHGVYVGGAAGTVTNFGSISASYGTGVRLAGGGIVSNGADAQPSAMISGGMGVVIIGGPGTVFSDGTIDSTGTGRDYGVFLGSGGYARNGDLSDKTSLIEADIGIGVQAKSTIVNYGTIARGTTGVLGVGGPSAVFNGSYGDTSALIAGSLWGIVIDALGTVSNYGTIDGISVAGVSIYGGVVDNGTAALIEGRQGIGVYNGPGTVYNSGTIFGTPGYGVALRDGGLVVNQNTGLIAAAFGGVGSSGTLAGTVENFGTIEGVRLSAGGTIINGSNLYRTALISNSSGIHAVPLTGHTYSTVISNFGTILGRSVGGILIQTGTVTNGSTGDRAALITGLYGLNIRSGAVANFGTINGVGAYGAVVTIGTLTNGLSTIRTPLIEGYGGLYLDGSSATNYAVIQGSIYAGVYLGSFYAGSRLTNGSTSDVKATVTGNVGVQTSGAATVTNFGTIVGTGGTAVSFGSAASDLVVEAGGVFVGAVLGGGGTLELANGSGTLSGLGTGTLGLSGNATAFSNFATVIVDAPASFTVAGNGTVGSGQALVVAGTLAEAGTLSVAGTLTTSGTLAGAGTLALSGSATLNAGTSLQIAQLSVTGGTLALGTDLAYAGSFAESAGTIAGVHLLALSGPAKLAGGIVSGATLATAGATSLSTAVMNVAGGGTLLNTGTLTATAGLILGTIGSKGTLVNGVGGLFNITGGGGIGNGAGGSGAVTNLGTLEKSAATNLASVTAPLANSGTILAISGTLELRGAVSGTGSATIGANGTLQVDSSVAPTQSIAFATKAGGMLTLNDPSGNSLSFAGTISGFGGTGTDKIDLATFAFGAGETAAWTQSGSGGTLKITDGAKTASIALFGQFATANFHLASDGGSGTVITDPPVKHPAIQLTSGG